MYSMERFGYFAIRVGLGLMSRGDDSAVGAPE